MATMMIDDITTEYARKIAEAMLKIEEAGMIPRVVWPATLTSSMKIKVGVDVEATIKSQNGGC